MTTWARVARSPLAQRLAPTTSRGAAPPRPGPAPPGIPWAPSFQPRRRAGQRFGGGCGGSEGGGGSSRCSPTFRRQTGGTTEAGPQEVSARLGAAAGAEVAGGGPVGEGALGRGRERSVAGRASPGLGAG